MKQKLTCGTIKYKEISMLKN